MGNDGIKLENKITNIVNLEIKNEEEINTLKKQLIDMTDQAEDFKRAWISASDELKRFKEENGVDILEEKLKRFEITAETSVREFQSFLHSVNLNDAFGSNDYKFEEFFEKIRQGGMTAAEAIKIVKDQYQALLQENFSQREIFDSSAMQDFALKLDNLMLSVDSIIEKINSIDFKSLGSTNELNAENTAEAFHSIGDSIKLMAEESDTAYESITHLIEALTKYASIDSKKIADIANTFGGIANIGHGDYTSETVDNIIRLTDHLKDLSTSGISEIKFDYSALQDIAPTIEAIKTSAEQFADAMSNGFGSFQGFNINFGLGGSNQIQRNAMYSPVAKTTLKELIDQSRELEKVFDSVYKRGSEIESVIRGFGVADIDTKYFFNSIAPSLGEGNKKSGSMLEQMTAYKEYISLMKEAADINGIDISSVVDKFSNDAEKLVSDATKILTGENELEEQTERLKSIFSSGINSDELTKHFDEVVTAINSVVEAIKELSTSLGSMPQQLVGGVDINKEEIEKSATNAAEIYKNAYDRTYNELSQEAKDDIVFDENKKALISVSGAYSDAAEKLNNFKTAYDDATRSIEQNSSVMTAASNDIENETKEENEVNKEAALSFQDAKRAVKDYYAALINLAKEKRDIELSENGFESESGRLNELSAALNRTKTAFDMFTSEEYKAQLSEEQQIELLKLMTIEHEKYAVSVERITNRAIDMEEAQRQKDALKEQSKAYSEAQRILTEYYAAMTNLSTSPNDIAKDENGVYKSVSNEWRGLADEVNRTTESYRRLSEIIPTLSLEQQTELTHRETVAKAKLAIATEKASAIMASVDARVNDSVSVGNRYESVLGRITRALSNYSAAENSRNARSREAYAILQEEASELRNLYTRTVNTGDGYDTLSQKVKEADAIFRKYVNVIREAGDDTKSLDDRMGGLFKRFTAWFSVSRIIIATYRNIKKMISATVELDAAMNQLQVVTRDSDATMSDFADTAAETSKRIGSSITDFVSSATTFARLGYSLDESAKLAEYTAMLQNVGDIDVSDAQDAITAIIKAYSDIDIDNIEDVMDKLVTVGNNFPISVSQIAEGMNNASSTLAAAGNSFEESVALLTAANTTIQNAAKSSTGLRTITARIRNTKADLDDLGETMTKANYDEIVQQLTKFNVSLTDVNGEYRSTYDIMSDIASMWSNMTSMEQAAMATALAGTRQQAIFYSIINNFQEASGAMDAMTTSAGALDTAYSTYLDSATAHINQFKASFQELAYSLVSSNIINVVVDLGKRILEAVTGLQKINILLPGIGLSFALIKGYGISKLLAESNAKVATLTAAILKNKIADDELAVAVAGLTIKEKERLRTNLVNAQVSGELTEEQYKQIVSTLSLAAAEDTAAGASERFSLSLKTLISSVPVIGWISIGISTLVGVMSIASSMAASSSKTISDKLKEVNEKIKQQQQEIQQLSNEYKNFKKSVNDIIPRFTELAKGVNEFGENAGLTDEQYSEFVELNNQIAEMFPELNHGMSDSGMVMLSLSYSANTLRESLENLLKAQRDLSNQEIANKIPEYLESISESQDLHEEQIKEYESRINIVQGMLNNIEKGGSKWSRHFLSDGLQEDVLKELSSYGLKFDVEKDENYGGYDYFYHDDEETKKILNDYVKRTNHYIEVEKKNIAAAWSQLNPALYAWLQTDYMYNELDERTQSVVDKMVSGLDFSSLNLNTKDEIEKYIRQNIINPMVKMTPEVKEKFENITDWQKQLKNGEITFDEFKRNVKDAFDSMLNSISDEDEKNKFKEMFIAGYSNLGSTFEEVVDGLIKEWGRLNTAGNNNTFTVSISQLNNAISSLKGTYDTLKKSIEEMASGGLSFDTIKSISDAVDAYNEKYGTTKSYLDMLYEENGQIKLNIDAWKEFSQLEMHDYVDTIQHNIEALEEEKKALSDEYNELINGNLDYNKRPYVSADTMRNSGWDDFNGDIATTYSSRYTIGEGNFLYEVEITPILEDGTVLTPEELNDYVFNELVTGEGTEGILKSDKNEIVINVRQADSISPLFSRDYANNESAEYWDELEDKLQKIKDRHAEATSSIEENQKKLEIYQTLFDNITDAAERTMGAIEKTINTVDELSSGFNMLDKMYADVFDKEDFDFSSLIDDKFVEQFSSYETEYKKFIDTVANSPKDIEACQSAFDELVTAYLKQSDVLKGLTEETRDVTVAMLEQMGVANAAELVDYNLALQKERLKYETAKYKDMTLEEVQALYNESEAGSLTQQVLAELALEKMEINANTIRTSEDIDNVIALANAANVSAQSLRNLTAAKIAFDKAEQYRLAGRKLIEQQELYGDMSAYAEATKMFELAMAEQRKAEEYFNQKIEFNPFDSAQFKAKYVGGSSTEKAREEAKKAAEKSKKEQDKQETWFEREYKLHQHLVKMEQETDADYFAWLNSAYQRAYKEGILTLDEYRKYQEEVFNGLRSLFEDYLGDIEHEISMREEFDGEKNKILSLYKQLIKDVENEIKAARAYGLTDTDDYIQELQKKWAGYRDAIKDIEDDINGAAKDAIDELIDIRVDMLKQDIDNEKDALKKKLEYLKDFYQKQKDMLKDVYDEEKYLEEQAEKRKAVSDIKSELAQLEYDNSARAQKRKLELAEDLAEAQKELDDFEKDHALEVAQEELDKLYEIQEKEINAQIDLLDEQENNAKALYEQALEDIKNGSIELYEEMIQWNDVYGDGISDTIKNAWEEAYVALQDYKDLYGTLYNGINLENATGYTKPTESWDTASVYGGKSAADKSSSTSSSGTTTSSSAKSSSSATTAVASAGSSVAIDDATKRKVAAAIWNGGYGWGRGKERAAKLAEVFGENNGIQALVNANVGRSGPKPEQEYTYLNMRKKYRGYALGTNNALAGLHTIDELGTETIFQSSDGAKYKMFTGSEKVLNAKASNFLYSFANKGGEILDRIMRSVFGSGVNNIGQPVMASNIQMGDIIINGNADKSTVSEIRRAQRDSVEMLLKEFNRLNK